MGGRPALMPKVGIMKITMTARIERVATISIAVLALLVSCATFYYQILYEKSGLSMQLMGFSMEPNKDHGLSCKLDTVLFNIGNRDAALIGASLVQGKVTSSDDGKSIKFVGEGDTYGVKNDLPGYVAQVVRGGEVRFLTLRFDRCNSEVIRSNIQGKGLTDFTLSAVALDHDGHRSNSTIFFARSTNSQDGRVSLKLRLDGQFDLMTDHANYKGEALWGEMEYWFKGSGVAWEDGYNRTSFLGQDLQRNGASDA